MMKHKNNSIIYTTDYGSGMTREALELQGYNPDTHPLYWKNRSKHIRETKAAEQAAQAQPIQPTERPAIQWPEDDSLRGVGALLMAKAAEDMDAI